MWGGMSLAWLCATVCFCAIVFRTDWSDPSLALEAIEHAGGSVSDSGHAEHGRSISNNNQSGDNAKPKERLIEKGKFSDIEMM